MRSNRTSRNRVIIIGGAIALLAGAIFFGRSFFAKQLSALTTHIHFSKIKNSASLPLETEAYIRALEAENMSLKNLLHVTPQGSVQKGARIVTWPSDSLDGTFMISAGSADGIQENDLVLSGSTLLGTVTRVLPSRSVISPIGVGEQMVVVTFSGKEGVYHAKRTGFGSFLIQVPKDVPVLEGDVVVVPYYDGRIIGTVVSVNNENQTSFTHVYVSIPVSIHDVRFVSVVPAVTDN